MKTITFTISKGGVGKSLITANVAAALAERGKEVILVEGDPSHPLQLMLNFEPTSNDKMLDDVVKRDLGVESAVHKTNFTNLMIMPSGMSLQSYFDLYPIEYARKIREIETDFVFIDTPFPLGKAALLSLGVCDYFVPILTEDEFVLCVESAIDTIRLGKFYLNCTPLGFVLNRVKTEEKFTKSFIKDLIDLLEIECLAKIYEDPRISKSYGGTASEKAFLAYHRYRESEFSKGIDEIAAFLLGELPKTPKKNAPDFLKELLKQ